MPGFQEFCIFKAIENIFNKFAFQKESVFILCDIKID